jgi:hypothetical protein
MQIVETINQNDEYEFREPHPVIASHNLKRLCYIPR